MIASRVLARPHRAVRRLSQLPLFVAVASIAASAVAAIPGVELVSTTTISAEIPSTGPSRPILATAANGRFTLFWSSASTLVAGDSNGLDDLFLHDALDDSIERINIASNGSQSDSEPDNNAFLRGGISDDGRYVVFASKAALVPAAVGKPTQIYRRDRVSGATELISLGSDGMPADMAMSPGPMTPDGRYLAFSTAATNFPHGTPAGSPIQNQVYRLDLNDRSIERVTVSYNGLATNGYRENLDISDDGRFVMFWSIDRNILPGDTDLPSYDTFLRDLQTSTTQQVDVTDTGAPSGGLDLSPSGDISGVGRLSADGRYAVFYSSQRLVAEDTDNDADVFRFDRITGTSELVSTTVGNSAPLRSSAAAAISADGSRVLYQSYPDGLFEPSLTLLRDFTSGTQDSFSFGRRLVFPFRQSLSDDGTKVFLSNVTLDTTTPFEEIYRFDPATATLTRLSRPHPPVVGAWANGPSGGRQLSTAKDGPSPSADARFVAFASSASNLVVGDTNGVADIFVRDRLTGTTELISARANGTPSDCVSEMPTLTPDARYVVFTSCGALAAPASGAQQEVYRYDRILQTMELVSVNASGQRASGNSTYPDVSADGNVVTFSSIATDLVSPGTSGSQVFVRELPTGSTVLVSRALTGGGGNSYADSSRISGNGRFVGYSSAATNLVNGDTNGRLDAFSFDRLTQSTERISVSSAGAQSAGSSRFGSFSNDGTTAVFTGTAGDLAAGTPSGTEPVYVRDRNAQTTVAFGFPSTMGASLQEATISADGRFVVFTSYVASGVTAYDDSRKQKLFLLDRSTGQYRALTWFGGPSVFGDTRGAAFSADGNWIAFQSTRDELVDNDGNGMISDIFLVHVHDGIFADDFNAP